MFQQYAVTYTINGAERGATTSTVETELDPSEEIRKMIACRRFGDPKRATDVEITELARLGDPTDTPVEPASPTTGEPPTT